MEAISMLKGGLQKWLTDCDESSRGIYVAVPGILQAKCILLSYVAFPS